MTYPLITKETQFDAVILADGDFPHHIIPVSVLSRAAYVCCCDGAGVHLVEHGLMPDVIVGDGDSMSESFKKRFGHIIHIVSEQDYNDLTKATRYCISKGFRRIAYLGTTGKREDHTIGNISLMSYYVNELGIEPTIVTDYGSFISAKGRNTFGAFEGQEVSVFNLNCGRLSGEGLKWKLRPFDSLWQGTLNEAMGNRFVVDGDGDYLVYLTHEGKEKC